MFRRPLLLFQGAIIKRVTVLVSGRENSRIYFDLPLADPSCCALHSVENLFKVWVRQTPQFSSQWSSRNYESMDRGPPARVGGLIQSNPCLI